MVGKELLIFLVLCEVEFISAVLKEREQRPECHAQTIFCPCTDKQGLSVAVKTCSVGQDETNSVCKGEAVSTKCRKAYLSSKRYRRSTGDCVNGTIPASTQSSALKGPPRAKLDGSAKTGYLDHQTSFKCTVFSNLSASVTWLFNGKALVEEKDKHSFSSCRRQLEIKLLSRKDAGNYTCVVENEKGRATATVKLSIILPKGPHIYYAKLEGNSVNTAYIGSRVNLTCKMWNSNANGGFLKNGEMVEEDSDQKVYEYFQMPDEEENAMITTVEIKNITMEDAANYTCYTSLNGQHTTESFYLEVEPCPPGHYCLPGSSGPVKCPWGTYQPKMGQTSPQACEKCPDFDRILNPGHNQLAVHVNITDCPPVEDRPTSAPSPSNVTMVIGIASGVVVFIVVAVVVLCFIAKKKPWLFSFSRSRHDPELLPCQPMLAESEIQNAEGAEVMQRMPEKDYEAKHDVFICYCYKDIDWVKELHAQLESQGFKCCIDYKSFAIGIPIVQNIAEAICYSRKTIAVLSPDFVNSNWCTHELHQALSRVRYHQVVPVMYKNCEIPLALQDTTYLEWENCHVKPYFWEQLKKALRKPNGLAYNSSQLQRENHSSAACTT